MGMTVILVCDFKLTYNIWLKNGSVVSEKASFHNVNNLEPRSRNDLDIEYSHIFIYSISCQNRFSEHHIFLGTIHIA